MIWQIEYYTNENIRRTTTFITKTSDSNEALSRFYKQVSNIATIPIIGPKYPDRQKQNVSSDNDTKYHVITTDKTEWIQDNSGIYTLINWVLPDDKVRVDVMSDKHDPIVSFIGDPDDVRKQLMRFLSDQNFAVSLEHAAYIGAELERCDTERIDYIQN